ncbi:phosphotransferase family protein [Actinoplanes rectilineatus]|uniref:phosphotransferase family protein n=1 Tax=Actinoplanes rectilineatus TaxID=113571 RepID=UPI000ACE841C|nr:phosphotransferase [Actinoplanes rectilineatus]
MTALPHAQDIARRCGDSGPLTPAPSLSHQVYLGARVVVKLIDSVGHSRLDRELALAPHLPPGLTAPLLASGRHTVDGREMRYACYTRMPGVNPEPDAATVRSYAEQAVHRLHILHTWTPPHAVVGTLGETLDHGGFTTREALLAGIEELAATGRVPTWQTGVLQRIAQEAPVASPVTVPVHADCHWGNWLADGGRLTALLDFEWARFGDPLDDWFFLIGGPGPHQDAARDVVARETGIAPDVLAAQCEVRHAAYLVADILLGVTGSGLPETIFQQRVESLAGLTAARR